MRLWDYWKLRWALWGGEHAQKLAHIRTLSAGDPDDARVTKLLRVALNDVSLQVAYAAARALQARGIRDGKIREIEADYMDAAREDAQQRHLQEERLAPCSAGRHEYKEGTCSVCGAALDPRSITAGWYFRARGGLAIVYGECIERISDNAMRAYCRSRLCPQGETGTIRIDSIECILTKEEYYAQRP